MTLEQEQQSDLLWATKVLNGRGDDKDSPSLAAWMLRALASDGQTNAIKKAAFRNLAKALGEPL